MRWRAFDLNVERILEHWEVHHAIREVIANAIDEEILTGTDPLRVYKKGGAWFVRDFGRGLQWEHLTQKENEEKLADPRVIGKFGIGLKDALATFDRRGIRVLIRSRHCDIRIAKSMKHGFSSIVTLHALVGPPSDPGMLGTEFSIQGCSDSDVEGAKGFFLRFSGERVLERTPYGQVLEKKDDVARIYVNGVRVAEEDNFLFSYNITAISAAIKRALNRERTNVGRGAYSERVKAILMGCTEVSVVSALVDDLQAREPHDEVGWVDVAAHACKLLSGSQRVVFVTPQESVASGEAVDRAKQDGLRIVLIPEPVRRKISGTLDSAGHPVRDLEQFNREWSESFEFDFVPPEDLSEAERRVFRETSTIVALIGGLPENVREIRISRTMRLDPHVLREADGIWDGRESRVVIKRSALSSLESYAGTLIHELCHATTGAGDADRGFEAALTRTIGTLAARVVMYYSHAADSAHCQDKKDESVDPH